MNPSEMAKIYKQACKAKRVASSDDEGRRWYRVLGDFDARDVETALNAWWADTTPTLGGRPRGAYMPEPVELVPQVKAEHKRHLAVVAPMQYLVHWCCPACRATCCGFVTAGDYVPRRCQGIPAGGSLAVNAYGKPVCGAVMEITYDERPGAHTAVRRAA